MKKVFTFIFAAILFANISIIFAEGEKSSSKTENRAFEVPGHGYLLLDVPSVWKQSIQKTSDKRPPVYVFTPEKGNDFQVMITPLCSPKNDPGFNSAKQLKISIDSSAKEIMRNSVEKELPIQEVKTPETTIYYFIATDKAPKPGEYPFAVFAVAGAGEFLLNVNVFIRDKQSPIIAETLNALKTAKQKKNTGVVECKKEEVPIPGEGWRISFDSPALTGKQESKSPDGAEYRFKANSERFMISIFVEKPSGEGKTNKDCFDYYWAKAGKNTLINKDTIKISETPKFHRVQYDIKAQIKKDKEEFVKVANVNYYFAFRGKWVDVHISMINPSADDEKIFKTFDETFKYAEVK